MAKLIKFPQKQHNSSIKDPDWLRKLKILQEALIEFEEKSGTEKRRTLQKKAKKEREALKKKK